MTRGLRPTRGVAAAVVASVVLHLLSRITGGGWLALASAAALVLPVVALLLRPRLDGLQLDLTDVRCRAGEVVEQRLVARNTSPRPSPSARLRDASPGLAPIVVGVPALAPGAHTSVVLPRTAVARGLAGASLELTSTAPLGLVRARREVPTTARVVVAPARVAVDLRADGGTGDGGSSLPLAGVGTEVLGLRPWRPGDGARAVHARSSARHSRPVVLERERDAGPVVVVLCVAAGAGPDWEAAVARTCALAEEALRGDRPPVLLATGHPAPARPDLAAVLDWHAGVDAALPADPPTVAAAVRAAGRGGTVVLLAPAVGVVDRTAAVRRACAAGGARVVVVGAA